MDPGKCAARIPPKKTASPVYFPGLRSMNSNNRLTQGVERVHREFTDAELDALVTALVGADRAPGSAVADQPPATDEDDDGAGD